MPEPHTSSGSVPPGWAAAGSRCSSSQASSSFRSPIVTAARLTPSPRANAARLEYTPSSSSRFQRAQRSSPLSS
ncbi:MAG: hypothetical protein H6741_27880 [Alphaproteobacteria bacterium]|nr:hypothetical protein [Alphaproteobacteria bacterium]